MFQDALIESAPHRTWKSRPVLASALAHSVAIGAVVWVSAQTAGEIGDPPVPIRFEVGSPPSPLGDGGGARAEPVRGQPTKRPRHVEVADQFHGFTEDRRSAPPSSSISSAEINEEDSTQTGTDSGGSGGDPRGATGGTGPIPGTSLSIQDAPIPITGDVRPPVLITRVDPVYPETARRLHLAGMVVLQAVINTSGRVEDLRVVSSGGAFLDAAAISAVERWIYRPAAFNGRAVKVFLTVTVQFALH